MHFERLGEVNLNNKGSEMKIIKYNSSNSIVVYFDKYNYTVETNYYEFKKGRISCPYDKTIYGVGYLGEGKYKKFIDNIATKYYVTWYSMLKRVYSDHIRNPSYLDCIICEEWHNFQNFCKWYDENYYEIEGHEMHIDKDILIKNNKVYSPETCVFVPQHINNLFVKHNRQRGEYPIGVNKNCNKYISSCNENSCQKILGSFSTPELAFNAYKEYKEDIIKRTADKYKEQIPQKLYDAMYRYEVEITD